MVTNNIRRYLWNYVNDTLKNLGEEVIETFNIHPKMKDFLYNQVINLDKQITRIEEFIIGCEIKANSIEEFKLLLLNEE